MLGENKKYPCPNKAIMKQTTYMITINSITLDISGLRLAKSTDTITPFITGTTGSITMAGTVVIDSFSSSSSVAVFIGSGATISTTTDSNISVLGIGVS